MINVEEEKKKDMASQIFKRELFTSFCIYYFPVMILMCMIVLRVDYLRKSITITFPLLCLLFPAIVSIIMAFVRVKIVWKVEYKPNWKNQALFIMVLSVMFLIEKIIYTILQQPDFAGILFFLILLLIASLWYKSLKQKVDYETVAKMLIIVSIIFIFFWSIFVVIVKATYSIIVLLSWILLFCFNLNFVLKSGREVS